MYSFEKLDVWQKTRQFIKDIYRITDKYPSNEQFSLIQHTTKSAISILSNIAESGSRLKRTDSQRFIEIAQGSLFETVAQLYIAIDNAYISKEDFNNLYRQSEVIAKMLSALWKSKNNS